MANNIDKKNKILISYRIKQLKNELKQYKVEQKQLHHFKHHRELKEVSALDLNLKLDECSKNIKELNQKLVNLKAEQFKIANFKLEIKEAKSIFNQFESSILKPINEFVKIGKYSVEVLEEELDQLKIGLGETVTPFEISLKNNEIALYSNQIQKVIKGLHSNRSQLLNSGAIIIDDKVLLPHDFLKEWKNYKNKITKIEYLKSPVTGKDFVDLIIDIQKVLVNIYSEEKHGSSDAFFKNFIEFTKFLSTHVNEDELKALGFKNIDLAWLDNNHKGALKLSNNFDEIDFFKMVDFYRTIEIGNIDYGNIAKEISLPYMVQDNLNQTITHPNISYEDDRTILLPFREQINDLEGKSNNLAQQNALAKEFLYSNIDSLRYTYKNITSFETAKTLVVLISSAGLETGNYKDIQSEFEALKDFDIRIVIGTCNKYIFFSEVVRAIKKIKSEYNDLEFAYIKIANHGSKNNPVLEDIIKELATNFAQNTLIYPIQCYGGQYNLEKIVTLENIHNNTLLVSAASADEYSHHPYEFNTLKFNKMLNGSAISMENFIKFICKSNSETTSFISGVINNNKIPHQPLYQYLEKTNEESPIFYPEENFFTPLNYGLNGSSDMGTDFTGAIIEN